MYLWVTIPCTLFEMFENHCVWMHDACKRSVILQKSWYQSVSMSHWIDSTALANWTVQGAKSKLQASSHTGHRSEPNTLILKLLASTRELPSAPLEVRIRSSWKHHWAMPLCLCEIHWMPYCGQEDHGGLAVLASALLRPGQDLRFPCAVG